MSGPIILISHNTMKEGRLEGFSFASSEGVPLHVQTDYIGGYLRLGT
jgi:hypothetical protein